MSFTIEQYEKHRDTVYIPECLKQGYSIEELSHELNVPESHILAIYNTIYK